MSITYTYICVAVAIFAALIADASQYKRANNNDSFDVTNKRLSESVLLLSPFLVFFYPEGFWLNFAGFMAVWALGVLALWLLYKAKYLFPGIELQKVMGPGICMLVGLGYLIFYHEGPLFGGAEIENAIPSASNPAFSVFGVAWYWLAYTLLIPISLALATQEKTAIYASFLMLATLSLLPFFTGIYWWMLGAGVLVFLACLKLLLKSVVGTTAEGGIGFILVYMAQMFFVASIVIYAIFF